jgi:hypothetical protein
MGKSWSPVRQKRQKRQKIHISHSNELCEICCENLNYSTHSKIICPHCTFTSCKKCNHRYLLESIAEAHCMKCRNRWTYKNLLELFGHNFTNVTYRKQRGNYLLDRSKSNIPLAMSYIDTEKKMDELYKEEHKILDHIHKKLHISKTYKQEEEFDILSNRRILLYHQRQELRGSTFQYRRRDETNVNLTKDYVDPCPVEQCRGFVRKADQKCGICDTFVCQKCCKILGKAQKTQKNLCEEEEINGNADVEDLSLKLDRLHICKVEDVESVKEIRKHSQQCPSCKIRIFRISGCDTMWCTNCNTGFNWRTGIIIQNVRELHNPHYAEFVRKNPNFEYTHNRNDRSLNPCDVLTLETYENFGYDSVMRQFKNLFVVPSGLFNLNATNFNDIICQFQQLIGHTRQYAIEKFLQGNQYDELEYAYRYLKHMLDEKQWRIQIEHHERFRQTNREYADLTLLWLVVMRDLFEKYLMSPSRKNIDENETRQFIKEMINITTYINTLITDMNQLYNRKTNLITMPIKVTDSYWLKTLVLDLN